jgi:hypothetical protein
VISFFGDGNVDMLCKAIREVEGQGLGSPLLG